jgi:hypothetical protein
MDFEGKYDFFETCKNSYTRPLSIANPEYGGHDKKYGVLISFCHKLSRFSVKPYANTYGC